MDSALPEGAPVQMPTVRLEKGPPLQQVQLVSHKLSDFPKRAERALGFVPSEQVGDCIEGKVLCLTIGQGAWLLCAEDLQQTLGDLRQEGLTAFDVRDARSVLRISGPAAAEVLSRATSIDWSAAGMSGHRCIVTLFSGVACVIRLSANKEYFDIFAPRSYAQSIWEWCAETIASIND